MMWTLSKQTNTATMKKELALLLALLRLSIASGINIENALGACDFNYHPEQERKVLCSSVYNAYEDALIKDPINLYTLREAFVRVSLEAKPVRRQPEWLVVRYDLKFNDTNITEIVGWSKSAVFNIFNPYKLIRLTSGTFFSKIIPGPFVIVLPLNLSKKH